MKYCILLLLFTGCNSFEDKCEIEKAKNNVWEYTDFIVTRNGMFWFATDNLKSAEIAAQDCGESVPKEAFDHCLNCAS